MNGKTKYECPICGEEFEMDSSLVADGYDTCGRDECEIQIEHLRKLYRGMLAK